MLQNEPLIAKLGFDTTLNGPSKVWFTAIPVQAPPVPVYATLNLLFEKIEWSAKHDHEWSGKNDHRWVIFIPSKKKRCALVVAGLVPALELREAVRPRVLRQQFEHAPGLFRVTVYDPTGREVHFSGYQPTYPFFPPLFFYTTLISQTYMIFLKRSGK